MTRENIRHAIVKFNAIFDSQSKEKKLRFVVIFSSSYRYIDVIFYCRGEITNLKFYFVYFVFYFIYFFDWK